MKRITVLTITAVLAVICITPLWADQAELSDKVDAFYKEYNETLASKNLDALMNYFADSYQIMGALGADRDMIRSSLQNLFKGYESLRNNVEIDSIKEVDNTIQVFGSAHLEGKKKGDSQWGTIVKEGFIEILKEYDGSLKAQTTGKIDLKRMSNIEGATYTQKNVGFSVKAPEGWALYPFDIPNMKDGVMFVMPDGHSPGFFGHVQIPYNVGVKQAIEGDDAAMKKLMKSFKIEKSGPVNFHGLEGYESLTRFQSNQGKEQTRHRIYLSGGGLLYVFVLSAPSEHWEPIQNQLMAIVNQFEISAEAKNSGAARVRETSASGEIMDRIFTSNELGCQIAAPKGWTIESTPLGAFTVSLSIKPPQGDSLVRLLAVDAKDTIEVNDVFEQEMKGIEKITSDFSVQEEAKDIELCGVKGRTAVFTFTLEGLGTVNRKSVMLVKNGILYMIFCDAIPPEKAGELQADFDAIVQSFTVN